MVFKNVALYPSLPKWLWNDLESENTEMSDSMRDAGFFAAIGILFATLIIGSIAVAGFRFPSLRLPSLLANKGRLTVQITDKPADLEHLNLTIDKLSIQKSDGENITLELKGGGEAVYFDLLALENVTLTLSETEIPAGNYTMIRMHVLTANATYIDGSTHQLRVPSEWMKVLLKPHLVMQSGGAITVTIDLEPDTINIANNEPTLNLKPTMKTWVNG